MAQAFDSDRMELKEMQDSSVKCFERVVILE